MIEITDIAITNLSKSFNHVLKTYAYFVKQKKKRIIWLHCSREIIASKKDAYFVNYSSHFNNYNDTTPPDPMWR